MIRKPYEHSTKLVHECDKKPKDWTYETDTKGHEWELTIEDAVWNNIHDSQDLNFFGAIACAWCGEKLPTIEEFEKHEVEQ